MSVIVKSDLKFSIKKKKFCGYKSKYKFGGFTASWKKQFSYYIKKPLKQKWTWIGCYKNTTFIVCKPSTLF